MHDYNALYDEAMAKYEKGGSMPFGPSFPTPTGAKSKLDYFQQILVRTDNFKKWFGNWEFAAADFKESDGSHFEFMRAFKDVSKCIDPLTLEPRVYYHGTTSEKEFFEFNVSDTKPRDSGIVPRPYGYFAVNEEYSRNFSQGRWMYKVFLRVMNPVFLNKNEHKYQWGDIDYWLNELSDIVIHQKRINAPIIPYDKETIKRVLASQLEVYMYNTMKLYEDMPEVPFWVFMAKDVDKLLKVPLMVNKFDGVFYFEELSFISKDKKDREKDYQDPAIYTEAVTIFDAHQVKLADGRNTEYNPMLADTRYEHGGKIEKFKSGGSVKTEEGHTADAKDGGHFHGPSHADGGIKAVNVSTGQLIEVEGGEVIITKKAVEDDEKREFEGEMLTNKEILSRINESGGGVKFEDGGEIHECACNGHEFKFGGETLKDYEIMRKMNGFYSQAKTTLVEGVDRFLALLNGKQ